MTNRYQDLHSKTPASKHLPRVSTSQVLHIRVNLVVFYLTNQVCQPNKLPINQ